MLDFHKLEPNNFSSIFFDKAQLYLDKWNFQ